MAGRAGEGRALVRRIVEDALHYGHSYSIFEDTRIGVIVGLEQEFKVAELARLDLSSLDIVLDFRHELVQTIDDQIIAQRQSGLEEEGLDIIFAQLLSQLFNSFGLGDYQVGVEVGAAHLGHVGFGLLAGRSEDQEIIAYLSPNVPLPNCKDFKPFANALQ